MNEKIIQNTAKLLFSAAKKGVPVEPIRNLIGTEDIDTAYAVQKININKHIKKGSKIRGKKIGLTSFAVQKQLGVSQPDFGVLLDSMEVHGGKLPYKDLMQPKIEVELAFILHKDLPSVKSMEVLIDAIEGACVSIEVVGSRVANWDICITDTIADNASASHFLLGNPLKKLNEVDLINCEMSLSKNGETVSQGKGSACMDNPLNAALWLAQTMVKQGNHLKEGEVLLSGALGPMVIINKGDKFVGKISGLGSIELEII